MSIQAADTSVRTSIVVEAPISRAFKVFTEDFGSFKPAEHNMLKVEIAETVFERKVGGFLVRPRGRRERMPLGAGAGLRAAQPRVAELGHQPALADRGRPAENERVGSTVHRRNPATHAGRDRAPQPRPPRRGLARRPRRRGRRSGLAALPAAIRQPVCQGALTAAPVRRSRRRRIASTAPLHPLLARLRPTPQRPTASGFVLWRKADVHHERTKIRDASKDLCTHNHNVRFAQCR